MINWQSELNKILDNQIPSNNTIINNKEIVLYGAGSMGEMALDFLDTISVQPKYIVDRKYQGRLRNINVIQPEDISEKSLISSTFIICIVTVPLSPIVDYLESLGCKNIIHFYDYTEIYLKNKLGNGWAKFELKDSDIENISKVLNSMKHDKHSLAHYLQFLWWRLRRVEKVYEEYPVLSNKKYFKAPCFPKLSKEEVFLDGGAHYGSTIKSFIEAINGDFKYIYAIEPDKKNLKILKNKIEKKYFDRTVYLEIVLSNEDKEVRFIDKLGFASKIDDLGTQKVVSKKIDSLDIEPTIIKLHIEGHELKVLEGAKNTIEKYRPILIVLADHNEDGLFKIAHYLIKLEKYKLYFYLHDYCGNSAIFYAIPEEKK